MTTPTTRRTPEALIVALTLAAYALMSFVSLSWFQVHIDEPGYTDPSASLLMGQGFTSGAWYAQGYEGFWAGNVPLHQLCLYLWLKWFGFSQVATRSLNIVFVVIGIALLWAASKRLNILKSATARVAAVILILCSHAGAIWINIGRTDAICVALAGLLCYAFSVERKGWRYTLISLVGLAIPWAGISLALVSGFAGILLLVFYRSRFLGEVACFAVAGVAGMGALLALYHSQGVLDAFFQSLAPHSAFFKKNSHIIPPPVAALKHRLGAFTDYTFLCLFAASACACLASWREQAARPWLVLSALSLLGVPILLAGAGLFPIYYAWFAFIPAVCALLALWERRLIRNPLFKTGVICALAALILLGMPRVWAMGFLYRADDVNGKSERFVASVLRADDVVLTQPQGWYGAKATARRVYHGLRAPNLTPAEAQSITVAICSPKFFLAQREILTGEWSECQERLSVPNRNTHRLPFSQWYRDNPTLDLYVYRRTAK